MIDADKHKLNIAELLVVGAIAALGTYATVSGFAFGVGTLARMGAGFFPAVLGIVLIALAIALFFEMRHAPGIALAMPWSALLFIFVGLCFWTATVRPLGLAPATFGLILIASLAERPFRPVVALVLALALSVAGVIIFIYGFRLPMTAINW